MHRNILFICLLSLNSLLLACFSEQPPLSQDDTAGIKIVFEVDMNTEIQAGRFDPESETVDIAGNFNAWGANSESYQLSDPDGDHVYNIILEDFFPDQQIAFKFRKNGLWGGTEEFPGEGQNRFYVVQSRDNRLSFVYNQRASEYIELTFKVNMNEELEQGRFEPGREALDIAGNFNEWGAKAGDYRLLDQNRDGIYEIKIDSFFLGQQIEFKFRQNGAWDGAEEFPNNGLNRVYQVQSENKQLFFVYNQRNPNERNTDQWISNQKISNTYVSFYQRIVASDFRGRDFRLRAAVKVKGRGGTARLWARVDKPNGEVGFFDNMGRRPISSNTWKSYLIEGTIDEDANALILGGLADRQGLYFFDDFQLFIQEQNGEWKQVPIDNAGFEVYTAQGSKPDRWGGNVDQVMGFSWTSVDEESYRGARSLMIKGEKAGNQSGPSVKFEHISVEAGLSQATVYCIFQDSLGFLWFGTDDGLNKYDGRKFSIYRHDPADPHSIQSNKISSIAQGRQENLWVGTFDGGLNRFDLDTEKFQTFKIGLVDSITSGSHPIFSILEDRVGNVWFSTGFHGLGRFDPTTGDLHYYRYDSDDPFSLSNDWVYSIFEDEEGILWISTETGLNRFDPASPGFLRFYLQPKFPNNVINWTGPIYVDEAGRWWVNTGYGLHRFNPMTTEFQNVSELQSAKIGVGSSGPIVQPIIGSNNITADRQKHLWISDGIGLYRIDPFSFLSQYFQHEPQNPFSLNDDQIKTHYIDREGILWVGALKGGINKYNPYKEKFRNYRNDPRDQNDLKDAYVTAICEDRRGMWWIGTKKGLYQYNPNSKEFKGYFHNEKDSQSLPTNWIRSIFEDDDGVLWISAWEITGAKSQLLSGGLLRFDRVTNDFQQYRDTSRWSDIITGIVQDEEGYIWLGTRRGLLRFDPKTGLFSHFLPEDKNPASDNNRIGRVAQGHQGKLWISTNFGHLYQFDPKSKEFQIFQRQLFPTCIYQKDEHTVWLGAASKGLIEWRLEDSTLRYYTSKEGLPNNSVKGILEDDRGQLWLSTSKGLSKFDINAKDFQNYGPEDGLQSYEFNDGAYFKSSQTGQMAFGGINGFNIFHSDSIKPGLQIPRVVISKMWRYNSRDSSGNAIEVKGIAYKDEIDLSYRDNILIFEFAALSYGQPDQNQYAYFLEGVDNQWIQLGAKNEVTFTNLSPGNYILRVKASNGEGRWNEEGTALKIRITPPWYWSAWSKTLYLLALIAALYFLYRFQLNRRLTAAETLRLRELDQVKTKLYTNITHEFRTPLTIISGMVNQIRENPKRWFNEGLEMIQRNNDNLLRLVNQMLDLRKLESGNMPLKMIQGDIVNYLSYLVESFHSLAEAKSIRLHFLPKNKEIVMDYDPEKIRHMMTNLLSNAIKFTPEGGDVYVTVDGKGSPVDGDTGGGRSLLITVKDTGLGIASDKLPLIFDRFYQADDSTTRPGEGTGVGLALTKELVKLLGGSIRAESDVGRGAEFIVSLPITRRAKLLGEENARDLIDVASATVLLDKEIVPAKMSMEPTAAAAKEDLPLVLIVEDNRDVVHYLRSCLEKDYRVEVAYNGQEGIDKALELTPDLIVSDVMMPEKDGFEVCDTLKNDERSSHIPIVMLTAKADVASKIEGLKRGADAYLPKPFHKEELLVRLKKLLELRQKLQRYYLGLAGSSPRLRSPNEIETPASRPNEAEASALAPAEKIEDAFVLKVRAIIEERLTDYQFGVEQLSREAALSRSQLNRKLTALTGYSGNRFIRYVRLTKAKTLLLETNDTIAAVAYDSGFNDPQYFGRMFKKEFGATPGEFRDGGIR